MNKRLLYGGATVSLIAIITYFNLENIANWWVTRKDRQEQAQLPPKKKEGRYFKNQFIVTYPKNQDSVRLLTARLERLKLKKLYECACSPTMALWVATSEDIDQVLISSAPDHEPPDNIIERFARVRKANPSDPLDFTGYNIIKNYRLIETSRPERVRRLFKSAANRLPQFSATAPEITVATIDSGVDTLVPGIRRSLYRNTSTSILCQPPFVEGIFGWNQRNELNDPAKAEPYDNDEDCLGLFSIRRGHGTLVNGVIGGMGWYPNQVNFTNNVNVNLKLLNVKFFEQVLNLELEGSLFDILCALNYAIEKKAHVINCSWYIPHDSITEITANAAFEPILTKLKAANSILVASSGNDGLRTDPNIKIWPAAFSLDPVFGGNIIAVGNWNTEASAISTTSNQGNFVDVYAPGHNVRMYNRHNSGFWGTLLSFERAESGTSFSAPFVAREAAILRGQKGVSVQASVIKNIIRTNTQVLQGVKVFTPAQ